MSPVSEILRGQSLHSIGLDGPSKLYARIQKIAIDGLKDVETFKQSWSNHESQELWKRTLNEPYPQGTNVWRTNYILALKDHKDQKQHQTLDMETFPADARNVKDIIQDFQAQHATIKLEAPNSAALLPFNITVAGMSFRVISNYQSSRGEYEVQYDPKSKPTQLQDGILSCLNQRLVKSNLEYLLVCDIMDRMRDNDLLTALAEYDRLVRGRQEASV